MLIDTPSLVSRACRQMLVNVVFLVPCHSAVDSTVFRLDSLDTIMMANV